FLRRFRVARTVEGDRLANERLEGGLVDLFSFVDVDRAAQVSFETRVEETGRITKKRPLGEGELHDFLVGFARADDAVMRPNRIHPLPLLDDVRVCVPDELAHSAEGFTSPVPELGDSLRDELRCRQALARVRLFHVLLSLRHLVAYGSTNMYRPAHHADSRLLGRLRRLVWRVHIAMFCFLRVQPLPAPELQGVGADDASNGLTGEKPLQHIEANVPPGSTHRDEAAIDVAPDR